MTHDWYQNNIKNYFERIKTVETSSLYSEFIFLLQKNAYILDAGCGTGKYLKVFFDMGFKVLGIDASEKMVDFAADFSKQKTFNLSFENMTFENEFDGIWANASLLHVSKSNLKKYVFPKCIKSLKKNGIWQMSFKYGKTERTTSDGRFFNDYDEKGLKDLIESFTSLKLIKLWKLEDFRPNRQGEFWVYAIVTKVSC